MKTSGVSCVPKFGLLFFLGHPNPHPLHLLTKDGSHECLSQADSACSTLSPTAAALMEHHMMENNLDQVVRQQADL